MTRIDINTEIARLIATSTEGSCGVCNRNFKVRNGKLSKHGYRMVGGRRGTGYAGFQNGRCSGSGQLALHISDVTLRIAKASHVRGLELSAKILDRLNIPHDADAHRIINYGYEGEVDEFDNTYAGRMARRDARYVVLNALSCLRRAPAMIAALDVRIDAHWTNNASDETVEVVGRRRDRRPVTKCRGVQNVRDIIRLKVVRDNSKAARPRPTV